MSEIKVRGISELDEGYFGIRLDHTGPMHYGLEVKEGYVRLTKAQLAGLISHLQKRMEFFED